MTGMAHLQPKRTDRGIGSAPIAASAASRKAAQYTTAPSDCPDRIWSEARLPHRAEHPRFLL